MMQATTTHSIQSPLTPRHYQLDGIAYATTLRVKQSAFDETPTCARSLISDAPGAGKTLQASEAASQLVPANTNHSICVIAPAHLISQWFSDIARQFPADSIISIEGSTDKRAKYASTHARWYIISVQSLRRKAYFEMMQQIYIDNHVDCCIIDESHYVKNKDAHQSVNVRKLTEPQFCKHVILLSATPIMREADDLYHQLRIIDPYTFHSYHDFLSRYCWFTSTPWGAANVSLRKGATDVLHANKTDTPTPSGQPQYDNTSGWMLGRSYPELGLELPRLIAPPPILINFTPKRRKMYEDIKLTWQHLFEENDSDNHNGTGKTAFNANSAMEVMHTLRRVINSPEKQETLTSYIASDQGPFFIVCDYKWSVRDVINQINEAYPNIYNVTSITGEIPAAERVEVAKAHAIEPNDILVATMGSITDGCDLSACNTVYFYEQATTPGRMHQVLSRVRRHRNAPSQGHQITISNDPNPVTGMFTLDLSVDDNERPVLCRYFHVQKTLDERIHAVCFQRAINVKDLIKVELQS